MHMKKALAQGASVPPNSMAMSGITFLRREKMIQERDCNDKIKQCKQKE